MSKKLKIGITIACGALVCLLIILKVVYRNGSNGDLVLIEPTYGDISFTVSTIGTIKPQNRLEIKPPITGRVERILVEEGQKVKVGDVLAFMSSTERATLVDAARLKGKQELNYWRKAYKETPLIAPIDGNVIVRDVEAGQTVTTSDAVLVLSDRLIIEADVDETDIGELKVGQKAMVSLDAYPEIKTDSIIDHISYESEVVNNVTIYKVDILPNEIPDFFRSGMSANVEVSVKEVKNAILIPFHAPVHEGEKIYVMVKNPSTGKLVKKEIETGLENDGFVEVKSGIKKGNVIYAPKQSYVVPKKKNGSTPFFPQFRRGEKRSDK
ncbi:MAG: HlyD family efflux transporter periplasmic adaptor subunit [Deltaproteobacteria bacterium]|jgi:membrane fusion protein, macrolide-specific efflux system|nr:HlyD family efflux transporter periplasmic adaptor subunit [Deltaproteobacteria bacterium]